MERPRGQARSCCRPYWSSPVLSVSTWVMTPSRTCTRKAQRLPQFTLQEFQRIFSSPVPDGAGGPAMASPALKICMENGKNADASTAAPPLITSRRFKASFFSDDLLSCMVPPQKLLQFRRGRPGYGREAPLCYKHYRPYGGPSRLFVGDMIALWSGFRNGANVAKPGLPSHGTEPRARVTRGALFRNRVQRNFYSAGRPMPGKACSRAWPTPSRRASPKAGPMSCRPTGMLLSAPRPTGRDRPGRPARFRDRV